MNAGFDHIDDLIGKVLAGEATPAEKQEVDAWCRAQETNQKYFNQLKSIFEKAASTPVEMQFDADQAWQRVKGKLRKEAKVVPMISGGFNWQPLRIAAGILLILAGGIFVYRWLTPPVQTVSLASTSKTLGDTLPDSSTVFLNKNSSLSYEYNARQKTRTVKLKGEGFFEIKHEEQKPFVIQADDGVFVRDIGTAFNVRSYPNKDTVEVIVQSGEVQFYTLKNPGLHVKAGETGIYSKRGKSFTKIARADTNALAYKTGVFSFHSTDLRSVVDRVNEVYDSRIRLSDEQLGNCVLTATFVNEDIDTVVEVIAETMGLTIEKRDGEVILTGTGCQ